MTAAGASGTGVLSGVKAVEGSDACFAAVFSMEEAPNHPRNVARGTFIQGDGHVQPAPVQPAEWSAASLSPRRNA